MNSTPAGTPIILQVGGIRTRRARCFPILFLLDAIVTQKKKKTMKLSEFCIEVVDGGVFLPIKQKQREFTLKSQENTYFMANRILMFPVIFDGHR